jgi:hypothetical protein
MIARASSSSIEQFVYDRPRQRVSTRAFGQPMARCAPAGIIRLTTCLTTSPIRRIIFFHMIGISETKIDVETAANLNRRRTRGTATPLVN